MAATAALSAGAGPAAAGPSVRTVRVEVGTPPLTGTLVVPASSRPVPVVVLVSGSGPEDQDETVGANAPFKDLAHDLAGLGIATLRYNKRTYQYPGSVDPATYTPNEEYVPDALAAIALVGHERGIDPHKIVVLGHSQGGTYAPLIAERAPQVAGVVLLAAASEPFAPTLVRQVQYLATLGGTTGAQAKDELAAVEQAALAIEALTPADAGRTGYLGGVGATYYLALDAYDPVATARALPQPLLVLQGGRDYQVTESGDYALWQRGLAGRPGVTSKVFPADDHLFVSGTGRATPADYQKPGHVDPAVAATIARWVHGLAPVG